MADGTKQYIVEYLVQADISNAAQNLTGLTSLMSEFQKNYGTQLRQTSVAADRILKSAKTLGKNLGKQFDMSGPIAQMQAFQGQLISTFNSAHKIIGSMFAGDLNTMGRAIQTLEKSGFRSEKALARIKGEAKSTSAELRRLANDMKTSQQEVTSLSSLMQRMGNAKVGKGDKAKWSHAALKAFTEDEQKLISKIGNDKSWAGASGQRIEKVFSNFDEELKKRISRQAATKKAYEKYKAENVAAPATSASSAVTNPVLMSAEEMDKKVAATRRMVRSMSKLVADQKGKPKNISYTVTVTAEEALGKLNTLKTEFEKLQALSNISVRVRGAGVAKTFKTYLSDIKGSVTDLQSTLATVADTSTKKPAKAKGTPGKLKVPATLSIDKDKLIESAGKLKGVRIPVLIEPTLGTDKQKDAVLRTISKSIPSINLKLKTQDARRTLQRFIESIDRVRNQTINLTATAGAKYTTSRTTGAGSTTVQPPTSTAGSTTVQPSSGRTPVPGSRTQSTKQPGAYRNERGFSAYPLVGNTSFGVQTPAFVNMAKGMVGMMGIGAAFSMIGDAMRQAVEYQNTMATVKAILESNQKLTGYTPARFTAMEKNVRKVGMDTKFTAPEVAGAARFMAMAGLSVDQINNSIRPVADVALIGDDDLQVTADKITNIQTAFGFGKNPQSMRKLADNLTTTFTRFNTDMMMTAEAMQYAAPIAHAAGLGIEETLAMIGVMGNAGIQSSMAGTTLRMALQNVINPNKKQKKLWDALGIKRRNKDGSIRNIVDILSDLSEHATDANLVELVSNMFRVTSMAGVTQVVRSLGQVKATRDDMKYGRDTGISERLSLEKQNTVLGLWAQVTSAFTEDNVQMFERFQGSLKDMLVDVRDYLRTPEAAENLNNIVELIKTMGQAFGTVAKIWLGLYNTFPGAVKTLMVAQFALSQIGMLLNPFVGFYRIIRNIGIGFGVSGAGNAAVGAAGGLVGVATKGNLAGFAASGVAARYIRRYGLGAFGAKTFGTAFQAARMSASLPALGGIAISGLSGLGALLGAIFSPIGIGIMTIAGTTLAIKKIMSDNKKIDKNTKNSKKDIQSQINELSKSNLDKKYFDTFDTSVRSYIPGYGETSGVSISQQMRSYINHTPTKKVAVPKLKALAGSDLLFADYDSWDKAAYGFKIKNNLWSTYINPILDDSELADILLPYTRVYKTVDSVRKISAIASIIREGGTSKYVTEYRNKIMKIMSEAIMSKDKNKIENAVNRSKDLINTFKNIGARLTEFDAGNMTADQLGEHTPIKYRQYWDAGVAILNSLLNPNSKYTSQLIALSNYKSLSDIQNYGQDIWFFGQFGDAFEDNIDTIVNEWFNNFDNIASGVQLYIDEKAKYLSLNFVDGVPQFDGLFKKVRELGSTFKDSIDARVAILQRISDTLNNIDGMGDVINKIQSMIDQLKVIKNLGFKEFLKQYYNIDFDFKNALEPDFHKPETPDVEIPMAAPSNTYSPLFTWGQKEEQWSPVDKVWEMKQKQEKAKSAAETVQPKINNPGNGNNKNGGGGNNNPYQLDQSDYKNRYQRSAARPTQIIFNIDNLCNFDRTEFLTADEREITDKMMPRVVHAISQAVATASQQIGAMPNVGDGVG